MVDRLVGGLDPGAAGAFAVFRAEPRWQLIGSVSWDARKATSRARVSRVIHHALSDVLAHGIDVAIENVGAMPQQGVSSTHRFGLATGIAEGIMRERGCRLHHVVPQKWKRHIGLVDRTSKRESLELARIWAPTLAKDHLKYLKQHNLAEAILLAAWLGLFLAHKDLAPAEAGKFGLLG